MTPAALHELLSQDTQAFNDWREAHPDAPIDLRGLDLRGLDLRGALLAGAQLEGCRFDDAALTHAAFSGAKLKGASFLRADLRGAVFGFAELFNAKLLGTKLGEALAYPADLKEATLTGARLDEINFVECDLTDADLRETNLRDANLRRAQLDGARQEPQAPRQHEDFAIIAEWLHRESEEARAGFILFMALTAQMSGKEAHMGVVTSVAEALGYDQEGFDACLPAGQVRLSELEIEPLESQWLRRLLFDFICNLAAPSPDCVNTLAHFGAQWGLGDAAMMRIMSEALGVTLHAARP